MGAIVLFDGVCNFCNGSVVFIIKNDTKGYFRFAPLQSETARNLLKKHGVETEGVDSIDSVILIENDNVFLRSTAALKIAQNLGRPWSLFSTLLVIPSSIRDTFYRLFARFRYRLFGKRDTCMMPTPEIRERFLELN